MMSMKRLLFLAMIILSFSGISYGLTVGELRANLDPDKNTRASIKEYWRKVSGKRVSGQGKVYEVHSGVRKRYKVFIKSGTSQLDYNVVLAIKYQSSVASLTKGQVVQFTGYLHDYSWKSGQHIKKFLEDEAWIKGMVIVLDNARINGP
jgi:hypothetical protein